MGIFIYLFIYFKNELEVISSTMERKKVSLNENQDSKIEASLIKIFIF
jgi:hypothetical protein